MERTCNAELRMTKAQRDYYRQMWEVYRNFLAEQAEQDALWAKMRA